MDYDCPVCGQAQLLYAAEDVRHGVHCPQCAYQCYEDYPVNPYLVEDPA